MSYYRLPSYKGFHDDCYHGTRDEPCWGSVNAVNSYQDEEGDWWEDYACEGHAFFPTYEPSRHAMDEVEPKEYDY